MRKRPIVLFVAALFMLLSTPLAIAVEKVHRVSFTDLIVTTSETQLILFGTIENGFTDEMVAELKSGVPIQFVFFIELYKVAAEAEPVPMNGMEFRHTMTYDTLKENYRIELAETHGKTTLHQSLEEAQKTMSEINGVPVIPLSQLTAGTTYQLRIRAELHEKTLPMSLHKVIPFLSLLDLETDWYSIEFNY